MAEEALQVDEDQNKGGNKLIIIIAAALLGIGVGAIGVYFLVGGEDSAQQELATEEPQIVPSIYYKLEKPFIVSFDSKGKQRYLQVDVTIKGKDQSAMDTIKKHEPVIKNNLNQLFGSQELATLQTYEGRQTLNRNATESVQTFLEKETGNPGIEQVLFTNFVMQ